MQEHEYKARDKTVQKMSRDGLREENLLTRLIVPAFAYNVGCFCNTISRDCIGYRSLYRACIKIIMALHHIDIFYISDFTVLNQNFRNLVRLIRRCGYCNFISSILQIFGAVLAKHIGIENSFCFCSFLSPGSSSS